MPTAIDPCVSFVIPVLNDVHGLRRCLASLNNNGAPSARAAVVVVDNGSTDGSAEAARHAGAQVLSAPGKKVTQLRNQGAALTKSEIIAFVDADNEISAGWLDAAVSALSIARVGGVGALCLPPSAGSWVQRAYGRLRGRPNGQSDVEWLGSGNMAVRREAFEEIGGFDTTLDVCEDVELCQRMRAAGWRLLSDARLESIHHGDPASLTALFKSELWRGRDNLRVSLRHLTVRGLPSIAIPIAQLASLGMIVAGGAVLPWTGSWVALVGLGTFTALAALRFGRVLSNPGRTTATTIMQAAAVSLTYDVARALALILRPRHRRATVKS